MTVQEHYIAFAPRLTNWLVSTGTPYAESCDLVQETFLKLWKLRSSLRDDANAITALAFTIARNLRKNHLRDSRHIIFSDEITEDDAGSTHGELETPSDNEYLHKRIFNAVKKLPKPLKEAYSLFELDELPIHEIAQSMHISETLVKVRIHRAREKLRIMLADLGETSVKNRNFIGNEKPIARYRKWA